MGFDAESLYTSKHIRRLVHSSVEDNAKTRLFLGNKRTGPGIYNARPNKKHKRNNATYTSTTSRVTIDLTQDEPLDYYDSSTTHPSRRHLVPGNSSNRRASRPAQQLSKAQRLVAHEEEQRCITVSVVLSHTCHLYPNRICQLLLLCQN